MRHYSNNTGIMQQVADNATKQALAGAGKLDYSENRGLPSQPRAAITARDLVLKLRPILSRTQFHLHCNRVPRLKFRPCAHPAVASVSRQRHCPTI